MRPHGILSPLLPRRPAGVHRVQPLRLGLVLPEASRSCYSAPRGRVRRPPCTRWTRGRRAAIRRSTSGARPFFEEAGRAAYPRQRGTVLLPDSAAEYGAWQHPMPCPKTHAGGNVLTAHSFRTGTIRRSPYSGPLPKKLTCTLLYPKPRREDRLPRPQSLRYRCRPMTARPFRGS
jgi:hypothetical protein